MNFILSGDLLLKSTAATLSGDDCAAPSEGVEPVSMSDEMNALHDNTCSPMLVLDVKRKIYCPIFPFSFLCSINSHNGENGVFLIGAIPISFGQCITIFMKDMSCVSTAAGAGIPGDRQSGTVNNAEQQNERYTCREQEDTMAFF